jgi:hypothetical protein
VERRSLYSITCNLFGVIDEILEVKNSIVTRSNHDFSMMRSFLKLFGTKNFFQLSGISGSLDGLKD